MRSASSRTAPELARDAPEAPGPEGSVTAPCWLRLRQVGLAASAALLAFLVGWSVHLYAVSGLSTDFGIYSQAFFEISHGHLDPLNTFLSVGATHYGAPFWRDHFELVMWPLSLLGAAFGSPMILLVVQDLCTAGAVAVAYLWGIDMLRERWRGSQRGAVWVAGLLLVSLLANPWVYWAGLLNFHLQALAALCALLAAREMWTRGRRRAWIWVLGVLLCGDVASTYVVGLGLSRLFGGKPARHQAVGLVALGVSWLVLVSALHANIASSLPTAYGYLSGAATLPAGAAGLVAIATGIVRHPSVPARMIGEHLSGLYRLLAGPGLIGIASPETAGVVLVVLGANALSSGAFLVPMIAFQSFPAELFISAGGVLVLCGLWRRSRRARIAAVVLAALSLSQILAMAGLWTPTFFQMLSGMNVGTSHEIAVVRGEVPPGSEVVVTSAISGRFADRRWVYPFLGLRTIGPSPLLHLDLQEPVSASRVVFVIDKSAPAGIGSAPPGVVAFALRYLRQHLHARSIANRDGIVALEWRPPKGVHSIRFPVPLGVLFPHARAQVPHGGRQPAPAASAGR